LENILEAPGVPFCDCGGIIKPDVVLYEEALNQKSVEESISLIKRADILIVGGTSLNVYPAAGMIDIFDGEHLILINKSQTPADEKATIVIRRPIGEVFGEAMNMQ